jgi:hypothetical protein
MILTQVLENEEKISPKRLLRWHRLWVPYDELPEKDKQKDRKLAKAYVDIFQTELDKHLDALHVVRGKDAERILKELSNPREPTKQQQKFIDNCVQLLNETKL